MDKLPNFLHLAKKVSTKGSPWLYKRIKQELKTPSYLASKQIVIYVEFFRRFIRRMAISESVDYTKDHLLVVYDLNVAPITFDFAYFLAYAETFAIKSGKKTIYIIFVMKDKKALIDEAYTEFVNIDSQKWRMENILISLVNIYPGCVGYSVLPEGASIPTHLIQSFIFPIGYSESYKPAMDYQDVFKELSLNLHIGFKAAAQGLSYIEQWKQSNQIKNPIVCITLRQYGYDAERNSNIDAWVRFAKWVSDKGYSPVFIPDTDACWKDDERLEKFIVFREGCWSLGLRMALYEISYVNFFYSNGCGALAVLSKKVRYILMMEPNEKSIHATQKVYDRYGWVRGMRRMDFAKPYQFLSLKSDSFENICDEFSEFSKLF